MQHQLHRAYSRRRGLRLIGISPPPGSLRAALIACDGSRLFVWCLALHARTVTEQKYHDAVSVTLAVGSLPTVVTIAVLARRNRLAEHRAKFIWCVVARSTKAVTGHRVAVLLTDTGLCLLYRLFIFQSPGRWQFRSDFVSCVGGSEFCPSLFMPKKLGGDNQNFKNFLEQILDFHQRPKFYKDFLDTLANGWLGDI